ncbi:hypothetical protein E2542_SST06953 [Spatholobus suberectus]|nr:hypothetical protein E2542_SST06953 [Spatholobus suberectus]
MTHFGFQQGGKCEDDCQRVKAPIRKVRRREVGDEWAIEGLKPISKNYPIVNPAQERLHGGVKQIERAENRAAGSVSENRRKAKHNLIDRCVQLQLQLQPRTK